MPETPEKVPAIPKNGAKEEPVTVPVDGEAQEEAGKVREESGGYD